MRNYRKEYRFLIKIINIFYPERCPYCGKVVEEGSKACEECAGKFPNFRYTRLARGGYSTVSPLPYDGIFSKAILNFKFYGKTQYAYQLALAMADSVKAEFSHKQFDVICCVPMHPKKLRNRKYNQSELLARKLSGILGIPYTELLIKSRNTEPQHKMSGNKRETNVKGAFRVRDKKSVKDRRILLVDDIVTTGNTLGECAKTLCKAGAQSVDCVTFACSVVKRLEIPKTL